MKGALLCLVLWITASAVQFVVTLKNSEPFVNTATVAYDNVPVAISSIDPAELFKDNCATCHNIVKDMTGPALRGIEERVRDKELLHAWIRNSAAVLKTGDPYFTRLYKKWDKAPMNLFPNLTDEEIDVILYYVSGNCAPSF
ncbi:MAG: cytochrome c [Chitinophagaceae bacterium]